jgi:hypothetical protein
MGYSNIILITFEVEFYNLYENEQYLFGKSLENHFIIYRVMFTNETDSYANLGYILRMDNNDQHQIIIHSHGAFNGKECLLHNDTITTFFLTLSALIQKPAKIIICSCYSGLFTNYIYCLPKNTLLICLSENYNVIKKRDIRFILNNNFNSLKLNFIDLVTIYCFGPQTGNNIPRLAKKTSQGLIHILDMDKGLQNYYNETLLNNKLVISPFIKSLININYIPINNIIRLINKTIPMKYILGQPSMKICNLTICNIFHESYSYFYNIAPITNHIFIPHPYLYTFDVIEKFNVTYDITYYKQYFEKLKEQYNKEPFNLQKLNDINYELLDSLEETISIIMYLELTEYTSLGPSSVWDVYTDNPAYQYTFRCYLGGFYLDSFLHDY